VSNDENGEKIVKKKEETQKERNKISLGSQPEKFKAAKNLRDIKPEKGEIIYIIHRNII